MQKSKMENKSIIADLLHSHGLKRTPIRTEMLDLFMNHDFALSASDLVSRMKVENDRATVYRALASFEEHGILHKASEDGHGIKYALCTDNCSDEAHQDHHAHFICDVCSHTYCLEEITVPDVEISKEFLVVRTDYTFRGICKECKDLS